MAILPEVSSKDDESKRVPPRVGHETWAGRVRVPEVYLTRGTTITDTAKRAITVDQINDLAAFAFHVLAEVKIVETNTRSPLHGLRLTPDNVQMYIISDYFVKPLTLPHCCSFVDLVSTAEVQVPVWFVSHAWSTPFAQTISMLEFHRRTRELPPSTPYWICTFAKHPEMLIMIRHM